MRNIIILFTLVLFATVTQAQITYPKIISNVDSKFEKNLVVGDSAYVAKAVISSSTVGTSENAGLEVNSTTSGVLVPRMTTTQRNAILEDVSTSTADSTAAKGLLIYNTTTNALNVYNNTAWVPVISVAAATALTASLTTVTASAPGTPDYAIANLTNSSPYGFVSADEGQSVLKVIINLQTKVNELEAKLQAAGLLQ